MKSKFYIAVAALFAVACSPITTDVELTNSFDKDNIVLKAYQTTSGSNEITLRMESEGVTGYWDYVIGTKYSDECTFIFPYTGTHTFTYYVTTPYIIDGDVGNTEYVAATIDVEVTVMDTPLADAYYYLVGQDLGGKDWVFDGVYGDGGVWWAMVAGYNYQEIWWNAAGWGQVAPVDIDGKMHFNVSGGANMLHYSTLDDTNPDVGSFSLNSTCTTLSVVGDANILGAYNGNDDGDLCYALSYEIIELTDDRLYLYSTELIGRWTGWVFVYKPLE